MSDQPKSPPGGLHPFIGRDTEMTQLVASLEEAIAGRGHLLRLTGEPGIGKTMLAEQLAARAQEREVRVLWGRCWEGGGAPAYWPWTQILRALVAHPTNGVHVEAGGEAAQLACLLPELAEAQSGRTDSPMPVQPDAARFRLFDSVTNLLRRATTAQPLLLVLDDLHAADPASLLLLRFVARELRATRLLILATYREVTAKQQTGIAELLGDLVREGPSVRLRGLGRTEVKHFVQSLTSGATAEDDVAQIVDATAGNPLFIREMVYLAGSDAPPGWHRQRAISEGVRAVIHQRLAALDAETVEILSVAAVVGQECEAALVAKVAGIELDRALYSLGQAEQAELVAPVPGSPTVFRFFHGLVREVLYDDLPLALRRELHGKVGEAIEHLYRPELTAYLGSLAYHFAQVAASGHGAKAGEYARRAGDQALDGCAYEEAILQYRRALDALRFTDPDEMAHCELLLCLGMAYVRAGDYAEAQANFVRAAEIARRLGAAEQLAQAALGFGEPQVEGGMVDQQLIALLQEALDRLSADDSALRSQLLARLSLELTFSDDSALRDTLRDSLSRDALAMARRLGDLCALAIACRARWMAVWGPDGLEERAALSDEILRLAREVDDRELELVGRARRITCSLESGDLRMVEIDIAAHAALAGELRMPQHAWTSTTLRAGSALFEGALEMAEALTEEAVALISRRNASLAYLNQITQLRWEQRRLGEVLTAWRDMVDRFPQAGFARGWLALAHAELNQVQEAKRHLHVLVDGLPLLPRGGLLLPSLAVMALAAARLEDSDAAAAVYPLLLPYAERAIVIPMPHPVVCFGSASFYLGLLAAVLFRWGEAGAHFEAAMHANSRWGARALQARTQMEMAAMLIRQDRAETRDRALALLDQAESGAHTLGLAAVRAAVAELRTLQARAHTGPAAIDEPAPLGAHTFHREGDYWTIVHEGTLVRVRDSKGLRYLARLLSEPGREFHAIELEGEQNRTRPAARAAGLRSGSDGLTERHDLGDAGVLLDPQAKAEYKARLQELDMELEEAESWADPERAAQVRQERDFLITELARAVGLGGRDRKAASHSERARLNVTRAIKSAVANIAKNHAALGQHLRSTIRTGTYCVYSPDPRLPITWTF